MKKNVTELVFIIDRSGSMQGLESDTIGGFNSLISKQKQEDGKAYVTTVLFNNKNKTVHDRVDIKEIEPMTQKDYVPGGMTALIDALGDTIDHIKTIHKYIRKEDMPTKTIVATITDGYENASHKYSSDEVKKTIEELKKNNWEFIFLGANIDAVETAKSFGMSEEFAFDYKADSKGTRRAYKNINCCMSIIRNKNHNDDNDNFEI